MYTIRSTKRHIRVLEQGLIKHMISSSTQQLHNLNLGRRFGVRESAKGKQNGDILPLLIRGNIVGLSGLVRLRVTADDLQVRELRVEAVDVGLWGPKGVEEEERVTLEGRIGVDFDEDHCYVGILGWVGVVGTGRACLLAGASMINVAGNLTPLAPTPAQSSGFEAEWGRSEFRRWFWPELGSSQESPTITALNIERDIGPGTGPLWLCQGDKTSKPYTRMMLIHPVQIAIMRS